MSTRAMASLSKYESQNSFQSRIILFRSNHTGQLLGKVNTHLRCNALELEVIFGSVSHPWWPRKVLQDSNVWRAGNLKNRCTMCDATVSRFSRSHITPPACIRCNESRISPHWGLSEAGSLEKSLIKVSDINFQHLQDVSDSPLIIYLSI